MGGTLFLLSTSVFLLLGLLWSGGCLPVLCICTAYKGECICIPRDNASPRSDGRQWAMAACSSSGFQKVFSALSVSLHPLRFTPHCPTLSFYPCPTFLPLLSPWPCGAIFCFEKYPKLRQDTLIFSFGSLPLKPKHEETEMKKIMHVSWIKSHTEQKSLVLVL